MSKLTLSVDDEVIRQAKSWAAREGTSVSRLVERYLREAATAGAPPDEAAPPVLRRLRGCLKGLDVLLDRAPWAESASALWVAVETRKARALLPAHGITSIHALMKRTRGGAFADRGVSDLLAVFNVARVSEAVLNAALSLRLAGFEEAVCAAAAAAARCDLLVTRDPARFRGSPVEVTSPGEALARLSTSQKATPRNR